MTPVLGTINDREILYLDLHDNPQEFEQMELNAWVAYVIADQIDHPLLESFAEQSIDKNVRYMAATGKAGSQVDDLFDMVMVNRAIEGRKMPDWFRSTDDVLLTTWHHDRSEGFWFLATTARYENIPIHMVLVANFTGTSLLEEFQNLTHKIRAGWLPGG